MKGREQRLQAILERICDAGPASADYRATVHWAESEFEVARETAIGYVRDLVDRRAVRLSFGNLIWTGRDVRGRP